MYIVTPRFGYNFRVPFSRMICSACGAELTYDSRRALAHSGGKVVCPYESLAHAELRAGHDRIYFGRWRKVEATSIDVRRAYHQIGRHLSAIGQALARKDVPAARRDLERALEAFRAEDPRDESPDLLRLMDRALSHAHAAIDDLLHEEGLPPHSPMDFAEWYDAVEVPFRDEW
ncbi:MAG: hypothetical protein ACM3NF_11865 [Gemmatimonadota bacterium]